MGLDFQKTWKVDGTPTNLVSPDGMTLGVYDVTAASQVVAPGTAMLNTAPGHYEYVLASPVPGHTYTATYTTVYLGNTYTSPAYTVTLRLPSPPKPPSLVDQLNTYMAAAIAAQAVGNYAAAINNAQAAQGLIACLPKISRSAGAGGGEMSASWDAAGIDQFIKRLWQLSGSVLGMFTVPITIVEPAVIDDGEQFANSTGGYVQ